MKRKGKAKLCCWCRLPGGRAIPGTSVWSRFSRNDSKRSSSTITAPAGATNRRAVTQSANLLKITTGLLKHMHISRYHAMDFALGGQIVQALGLEQPDLVATLTIAATGPGSKRLDGKPRDLSPEMTREIHELGFERYIRKHIDNDSMAFNPNFYHAHHDVASALSDALWSGQSTVEQFRLHEQARLTWDALGKAPQVRVATLILCGADDDVNRRGSTPVGTARRLSELIPSAELILVPGVEHMTFWDGRAALEAMQAFFARHPIGTS